MDELAGFGVNLISMLFSALQGSFEPFAGFQKCGFAWWLAGGA
jgi:hypothetical protein